MTASLAALGVLVASLLGMAAWIYRIGFNAGADAVHAENARRALAASEQLRRRDAVANRSVSDAELDRSLKDGTF